MVWVWEKLGDIVCVESGGSIGKCLSWCKRCGRLDEGWWCVGGVKMF